MPSIEELRARFQRDRFAAELTGADIRECPFLVAHNGRRRHGYVRLRHC